VTVDDDAPRLSSTEVRKLITLMELPFVVPFEHRVKVGAASQPSYRSLIYKDYLDFHKFLLNACLSQM